MKLKWVSSLREVTWRKTCQMIIPILALIRRGEYVTVLYKVINKKDKGEWLGRMVLGYEKDKVRIFGATLF